MNTQNILKFYGTKLDLKLDSSEFYDYQIGKESSDYNLDVLDLTTPITYTTLKIDTTLENLNCSRDTITLFEIDNTDNDDDYIYSGLTATINYTNFVNNISNIFIHTILNNNIFLYTGITGEDHYFGIERFNDQIGIDENFNVLTEQELITGFTQVIKCESKLESNSICCPIPSKLNSKPWAYQFIDPILSGCTNFIERRVEKGWSLDFIFNREEQSWSDGSVFYYYGTRGTSTQSEYSDNNLSFQFTPDGRIKWVSHHYSGICQTNSGFVESYYILSGQTPQLCTTDDTKDFNITIVFDRYRRFEDCDLENMGGFNDLLGWKVSEYSDIEVTAVTSTQLSTFEERNEFLNKKWADEKYNRLGTLKIYLNGRPIYKLENWEEIVSSNRGLQPFIQSWGGGTGLMNNIHNGVSCFNIKSIKYYEEPLDFVHVRHNFLTRLNQYDFFICGDDCVDNVFGLSQITPTPTPTPTENGTPTPTSTPTETPEPTITPTEAITPTPTSTETPTITPTPTSTETPTPTNIGGY